MILYYRDFETGKRRWTHATPVRAKKSGPLGSWGLLLKNRASELWVPEYCLRGMGTIEAHYNYLRVKAEDKEAT